jgi:preprotein translocase subunit SecE
MLNKKALETETIVVLILAAVFIAIAFFALRHLISRAT